jgi:hypothetical protein
MPGMMGPNSQSTNKGSHNSNMTANLQHNLLLQQGLSNSQLGKFPAFNSRINKEITIASCDFRPNAAGIFAIDKPQFT